MLTNGPNIYQAARKEGCLTQEQAAERLEVSETTVKAWEQGARVPDNETVARMAELYGTPWLLLERAFETFVKPPMWCFYSTPHRRFTQNLGWSPRRPYFTPNAESIDAFTSFSNSVIFPNTLFRLRIVPFFHTQVYFWALASIFVPSI